MRITDRKWAHCKSGYRQLEEKKIHIDVDPDELDDATEAMYDSSDHIFIFKIPFSNLGEPELMPQSYGALIVALALNPSQHLCLVGRQVDATRFFWIP